MTEVHNTEINWVVFSVDPQRKKEAIESVNTFLEKSGKKTIIVQQLDEKYFPYNGMHALLHPFDPYVIFTHYQRDYNQDHKVMGRANLQI